MYTPPAAPSSETAKSTPEITPQQRTQFFIFLLIGMCLVFAVSYTGRVLAKMKMDNAVVAQEARNVTARDQTVELQDRLLYVQSDAYAEEQARGEFGMAQPGDKKVVILPDPQVSAAPMAPMTVNAPQPVATLAQPSAAVATSVRPDRSLPIWRQWLLLFHLTP